MFGWVMLDFCHSQILKCYINSSKGLPLPAGLALTLVRDLLGHADFRSTLVYARIKRETLQEAMKVFNAK